MIFDQLAFYRIDAAALEKIRSLDLLVDGEVAEHVERRGTPVTEFFLDGRSIGALLGATAKILGAPVDALIGRTDLRIEPAGPAVWISHLPAGEIGVILKGLARAARLLRDPQEEPAVGERLKQAAADHGGAAAAAAALGRVQRELETASRAGRGELLAVFTKWR